MASDRIELYTGPYAEHYTENPKEAILPYFNAALVCKNINLEINAGHDLSLNNLSDFISAIPETMEVSIGHALISDALYYGIKIRSKCICSKYLKDKIVHSLTISFVFLFF